MRTVSEAHWLKTSVFAPPSSVQRYGDRDVVYVQEGPCLSIVHTVSQFNIAAAKEQVLFILLCLENLHLCFFFPLNHNES